MASFWDKVKETLKEKASTLGEKVGEYSKYSKLAIQKYNLTKQVEKLAADLGGRVYTLFSEKLYSFNYSFKLIVLISILSIVLFILTEKGVL